MTNKKYALINILALSFFLSDLYFKYILSPVGRGVYFFDSIIGFDRVINYGVAFGLHINYYLIVLFYLLAILILIWFLYLQYRDKNQWNIIAYTFIILGAVSNLVDRIVFGGVVDYFYLQNFSVFNIADIMIVGGVFGVFVSSLRDQNKLK
jgi:signal peptidase II